MTRARPINLRQPTLSLIMSGTCTALRRAHPRRNSSALANLEAGDALWIREPFHLKRKFDHLAPTATLGLGAAPYFAAAPHTAHDRDQLGKQWPAYAMPRAFHRHHLIIERIFDARLKDITNAEINAEGYKTRQDFAAAWNRNANSWGGITYGANPTVLCAVFRYVGRPIVFLSNDAAAEPDPPLDKIQSAPENA